MCGLIGAIGESDVLPALMQGLRRVEHRDHDSVGVGFVDRDGVLGLRRCVGKLAALEEKIRQAPFSCSVGIGHSRWATHGAAEPRNVHPQISERTVAVVHNGSVENHQGLRQALLAEGYAFRSATDTEVIAHLVHRYLRRHQSLLEAVRLAVRHLAGPYAIAAVTATEPDLLVAARHGSPLLIGLGRTESYVASDATALLPLSRHFIFLEDGDVAALSQDTVRVIDRDGLAVQRSVEHLHLPDDLEAASGQASTIGLQAPWWSLAHPQRRRSRAARWSDHRSAKGME